MPKMNVLHHAFNVGVHDTKHLARVDLERMRLAAETQTNLLALTTGPGFMRPGLEYLGTTRGGVFFARLFPFVFGVTDAALMDFSSTRLRIWADDELITRPSVTAAITSGTFSTSTGWTLTATDGATSAVSGGYLNLTASARGSTASATQTVAVNETGTEHALRIVIDRGPVTFRCGSSSGGDEYIAETTLRTGTHSLAFIPTTSNFYIEFKSELRPLKRVDSIEVEAAGIMELPTEWLSSDMDKMRFAQSADVVFVACSGYRPKRIERRSARSWSVVNYTSDDGPFTVGRTRAVKLKSSVTEGNGTLTASDKFFNANHVGAIFRLTSNGTEQTVSLANNGTYTDPFRVTGIMSAESPDREWEFTITGTWSGTLRWYRSFDDELTGFKPYRKQTGETTIDITANEGPTINDDTDDNAVIWYKIGFDDTSYTSGSATIAVSYASHGGDGVARVTAYNSATSVDIEVLHPFRSTNFTDQWEEGEWSANRIWPSSVAFSDGRLFWSGSDRLWGSISDAFDSFDDSEEGDSGPIIRSIATGGVNDTQWLMALQRLMIGTEGAVATVKSSSFDEPLTPTNNSIKDAATTGAAPVDPVKVDTRGLFVERSGTALMELTFDGPTGEYVATQLSKLVTDIFAAGVKQIAVQRRPDTRVWIVLDDGSCICLVYEPSQDVVAFIPIETEGNFESVAVLPSAVQDRAYFVVSRTINGSTARYVEKMAMDSEVKPSTVCKVMDAFSTGTASASTSLAVGTHLTGETVVVWVNGAPLETAPGVRGEYVVNSLGNITLPSAVTGQWCAGLPYRVRYKSARLAYGAAGGTAVLQKKKVDQVGFILTDFVRAGLRYGPRFDDAARPLDPLPVMKDGVTADAIVLSEVHDEEAFMFPGEWSTDSRVCFEVNSPYTATFLGLVIGLTTNG